ADETARRLRVEARALIEKGERLLATASGEDADDLVNGIESVKEAITGSSSELKAAIDVFADLLYYLDA
ncbi:MAG TPA: heat-shock protein Hsp70, partial [Accumulibacter sp.]|nr:heat-shock protein Hsp70 [Accumulibacter sp.]